MASVRVGVRVRIRVRVRVRVRVGVRVGVGVRVWHLSNDSIVAPVAFGSPPIAFRVRIVAGNR